MANFSEILLKVRLVGCPYQPDSAYLENFDNPAQLVVSDSGQEVRAAPMGKQSGQPACSTLVPRRKTKCENPKKLTNWSLKQGKEIAAHIVHILVPHWSTPFYPRMRRVSLVTCLLLFPESSSVCIFLRLRTGMRLFLGDFLGRPPKC